MNWVEAKLGDVCRLYQPEMLSKKEMSSDGPFPVFGANGVIGRYTRYNHAESEVVLGCRGSCGALMVTEPQSWITSNAMVIRPKCDNLEQAYLRYALAGLDIRSAISGVAQPQITRASLSPLTIRFPEERLEQRRIVAILDEAFEGIATATANAEKNLFNARDAFNASIDRAFAARDGIPTKRLGDLVSISHGFAFDGGEFRVSTDETRPIVITPGNYTSNAELSFTEKNTKRFFGIVPSQFRFALGDLTVVMTDLSSKMNILGKPAFVNGHDVLHNQRIGRVIPVGDGVDLRYIYYFLRTSSCATQIKATATGTMVRHTAPKRIMALGIPLAPVAEQRNIITRLDQIGGKTNNLEDCYSRKLALLAELKQSILHRAFNGDLSPAEALAA